MTSNDIYTVAGNGKPEFSGDGGPALRASLAAPEWVHLDPSGNVLINDTVNERVRAVAVKSGTFYGVKMTRSDIYTVAGDGVPGFFGTGGPVIKADMFSHDELPTDSAGNLFFGGDRVLEVCR